MLNLLKSLFGLNQDPRTLTKTSESIKTFNLWRLLISKCKGCHRIIYLRCNLCSRKWGGDWCTN